MNDIEQLPTDFARAFEGAFARLQVAVEGAYPAVANLLTNEALARGREGFMRYQRVVDFAARLLVPGRELGTSGSLLPDTLERSLAGGITLLVTQRLDFRAAPASCRTSPPRRLVPPHALPRRRAGRQVRCRTPIRQFIWV